MKRFLPSWIKTPIRRVSDFLRNEGHVLEMRGRRELIHKAIMTLEFNGIPGAYAEFGCAGANTFSFAHRALRRCQNRTRSLLAFDSFAGLPPPATAGDEHPRWTPGTLKMEVDRFHAACRRKGIRNYQVIPGFYKDTLRERPLDFFPPGSIAFAYVDCDVYSSAQEVCSFLLPRLQHGMIVAFDDYWCYSGDNLSGERHAYVEALLPSASWHFEPYQSFAWAGMSFVVERKSRITAGAPMRDALRDPVAETGRRETVAAR